MTENNFNLQQASLASFLGKAGVVLIAVLTAIIFARGLGPQSLGVYFFTLAIGLLLSNFISGIGKAIQKNAVNNSADVGRYYTIGLLGAISIGGLLSVFLLLTSPYITTVFGFVTFDFILAICGVTITIGAFEITNDLFGVVTSSSAMDWATAIRNTFILITQVGLLFLNWSLVSLLFAFAGVTFVCTISLALYSGLFPQKPTKGLLKTVSSDSIFTIPVMIIGNLFGRVDIFIIGMAATATAIGYYEAAYRVLLPGLLISASASRSLTIKTSGLSSGSGVRKALERAVSLTGFLAIPIFFISISIPNELLSLLLGPAFIEGATVWPYIVGLAFVLVMTAYREPFNATIRGLNRPKIILVVQTLFLLINIPLSFSLISLFGGVGAVIGTAITEFCILIAYEFIAYKYLGGFVIPELVLEQLLAGIVLFMFLKPFALIYNVAQPLFFAIAILGSIITYLLLLLIISSDFRYYLQELRTPTSETESTSNNSK